MIDKKDIEKRLSALADGEKCNIQKVKILIDKEYNALAYLVFFNCADMPCSCVVYDDGSLFHLRDWQASYPNTAREVEEFEYLTEDGLDTIMMNGLPRSLK